MYAVALANFAMGDWTTVFLCPADLQDLFWLRGTAVAWKKSGGTVHQLSLWWGTIFTTRISVDSVEVNFTWS